MRGHINAPDHSGGGYQAAEPLFPPNGAHPLLGGLSEAGLLRVRRINPGSGVVLEVSLAARIPVNKITFVRLRHSLQGATKTGSSMVTFVLVRT